MQPQAKRYLQTVLQMIHGWKEMGIRSERELETLATALGYLLEGNLAAAGDCLAQRFKAVQWTASGAAPWSVAEHLEVIGPTRKSLISPAEQAAAQEIEYKDLKLQRLIADRGRGSGGRLQSRSPGGSRGPSG